MGLTMLLILSTRCDVFCIQKGFDLGEYREPSCACIRFLPIESTWAKPMGSIPRSDSTPVHRIDETWDFGP